jgi:hypothetical protein
MALEPTVWLEKEAGRGNKSGKEREKEMGRRGSVGPRGKEGEARAGRAERKRSEGYWALFLSSLLFFFFPTLKLFKQFYLKSNKFEFKPFRLNTNKTMLQHECINKLIL